MDILLQRHEAKLIYKIPEGLTELMSDISREVLRAQPTEIYCFIADYLDSLFITRMNALVAERVVDTITEAADTIVGIMQERKKTRSAVEKAATVIQKAFRAFLERKTPKECEGEEAVAADEDLVAGLIEELEFTYEEASKAASTIQKAFRAFKLKKEEECSLLGIIDWRMAASKTIKLLKKASTSPKELNRAATLIKAAYKGYYTRRIMSKLMKESEEKTLPEQPISDTDLLKRESIRPKPTASRVGWEDTQCWKKQITISEKLSIIDEKLMTREEDEKTVKEILEEIFNKIGSEISEIDQGDQGDQRYQVYQGVQRDQEDQGYEGGQGQEDHGDHGALITLKDIADDAFSSSMHWLDTMDERVIPDQWGMLHPKGSKDTIPTICTVLTTDDVLKAITTPKKLDLRISTIQHEQQGEGVLIGPDEGSQMFQSNLSLTEEGDINQSLGGERPTWANDGVNDVVVHIEGIEQGTEKDVNVQSREENFEFGSLKFPTKTLSTILETEG